MRGPPSALPAIAARHGALGIAVAHTGSAVGLLFAPGSASIPAARSALKTLGATGIRRFRIG
ncbi:MAG: hypothetical protein AAF371_01400 [Pseudomonadota bacterium]